MITLNNYKNILKTNDIGLKHRQNSANVLDLTWDRDTQTRTCYLYDYFNDSEPTTLYNLHPQEDELKQQGKVRAKFVVSAYGSLTKDQVEYHLQFKPSHTCELDYFEDVYGKPYNVEYPLGLYIDIPEGVNLDVYRRWLICSRDYDNEFISYSILPCDECFHWVDDDGKEAHLRDMCGVSRMQNSYNSGLTKLVRYLWKLR